MAQGTVPLTAAGKARLEDQLDLLRTRRRPELMARIQDETESGDVSDNSEYEELKETAAIVDARIRELEQTLSKAVLVEAASDGTVGLGSSVTLRDGDGVEETWTLVSPQEANAVAGTISTGSPVGRAVLGCRKGDSPTVRTPVGEMVYVVVEVA
ncbi:MAG TPA: transcription elongation factor GreA [Thermomicrobiales bacterium]|nr:transcription elongation factor GreA [Thermomicrobiales bacterium]